MRQTIKNNQLSDLCRRYKRLATFWLSFSLMSILLSGAWLITACTQTKKEPVETEQQTRPRRSGLEIKNPSPDNRGVKESGNQTDKPVTIDEKKSESGPVSFYPALEQQGVKLAGICSKDDPVARRVLEDYGAMFVASRSVKPPPVCMFTSEAEVTTFQNDAKFTSDIIGGSQVELQPAAMEALLAARKEAQEQGLNISPRGGREAARRSYNDTLRLWNSRFFPALTYWNSRGRLTNEQVTHLRKLHIHEQVAEVLELEKSGIFFSKDLSKSILYSVAAPGTSQHISMLALDVSQFGDPRVRRILALHGWFQTVKSDLPHFTYLGFEEKELPSHGLHPVRSGSQLFWIPNIGDNNLGGPSPSPATRHLGDQQKP
jgi:hypothetical protein